MTSLLKILGRMFSSPHLAWTLLSTSSGHIVAAAAVVVGGEAAGVEAEAEAAVYAWTLIKT